MGKILLFGDQLLALRAEGTGMVIFDVATKGKADTAHVQDIQLTMRCRAAERDHVPFVF